MNIVAIAGQNGLNALKQIPDADVKVVYSDCNSRKFKKFVKRELQSELYTQPSGLDWEQTPNTWLFIEEPNTTALEVLMLGSFEGVLICKNNKIYKYIINDNEVVLLHTYIIDDKYEVMNDAPRNFYNSNRAVVFCTSKDEVINAVIAFRDIVKSFNLTLVMSDDIDLGDLKYILDCGMLISKNPTDNMLLDIISVPPHETRPAQQVHNEFHSQKFLNRMFEI